MAYFMALDIGGTKADYAIADETRELARVRTGTIKRMRADADAALKRLEEGLGELTARTQVPLNQITRTCVGTAGENVPLVANWLRKEISARVGGDLVLCGDVEIALDAAFQGGAGVLVLAGTGSNVVGRTLSGRLTTAGGHGPALSDQGSGHRIGQRALRDLFMAHDQGMPTALESAVLQHWSLSSLDDLVAFANASPGPDTSSLTQVVVRSALAGDQVAEQVLRREGEELARVAVLVLRRLCAEDPNHPPTLAFAGSIMEHVAPVREALMHFVHREFPSLRILENVVDPLQGALWRARVAYQQLSQERRISEQQS